MFWILRFVGGLRLKLSRFAKIEQNYLFHNATICGLCLLINYITLALTGALNFSEIGHKENQLKNKNHKLPYETAVSGNSNTKQQGTRMF